MKKRKTIITEDERTFEVRATWSVEEANELLSTGNWILHHACVAHKDMGGFQAKPCWLLGRIK